MVPLLAVLSCLQSVATAMDTTALDDRWMRDRWTREDGLPLNHVSGVAIDAEGIVWVSTFDGLARFDGVAFKVLRVDDPGGPPGDRVSDVAVHPTDGAVWVSTVSGDARHLQRRTPTGTRTYSFETAEAGSPLLPFAGSLWTTVGRRLLRLDERPALVDTGDVSVVWAYALPWGRLGISLEDLSGRELFSDGSLGPSPTSRPEATTPGMSPIPGDSDSWLARRTGLDISEVAAEVFSVTEHDNTLWLATIGDGLVRLRPRRFHSHRDPSGGRTNVSRLFVHEDDLWARTRRGWFSVDGPHAGEWLALPELTAQETEHSVLFTGPDGTPWLKTGRSIYRQTSTGWLGHQSADDISEMPDGTVFWYGWDHRAWRHLHGRWTELDHGGGRVAMAPSQVELADGDILFTGDAGIWRLPRGASKAERIDTETVLDRVRHMRRAGDHLWLGTDGDGLCVASPPYEAPLSIRCLGRRSGVGRAIIHATLADGRGRLWLSSNQGIGLVDAAASRAFSEGRVGDLHPVWFDTSDGMLDAECNGFAGSSAARTSNGHLWFASQDGVIEVDPAAIELPAAPTVVLASVQVGDDLQHPHSPVQLGSVHAPLQVSWTTAADDNATRQVFRYRLSNERAWSSPSSQRSLELPTLPPGDTTLEVQARLGAHWGPAAALHIHRTPAFQERGVFPLVVGLLLSAVGLTALGGWSLVQARLRRRLEAQVESQTGQLQVQNDLLQDANATLSQRNLTLARTTEQLRARNLQIGAQAERLQELDRLKRQLIANLSHELRTPLSLILGPISSLQARAKPSSKAHRSLSVAVESAQRLNELIGQLFDLSRVEAGGVQLRVRRLDLVGWLRHLLLRFEPAAEAAGIDLLADLPEAAVPTWFDPDLMDKVLSNLLRNALRFSPRDSTVVVGLQQAEDGVQVNVEDQGPGVPPALREQVFERFFQLHGAHDRTHEGAGIGLSLVRELVELHGGGVGVEPGAVGARFWVELPAGVSHFAPGDVCLAPLPEDAPSVATPVSGNGSHSSPSSVLLVEDHPDLRAYLAENLAERFDVVAVPSGRAALDALATRTFALVVSDIMMPEMDGLTLVRRIRSSPGGDALSVLFISARTDVGDRVDGLELADDYLAKPFQMPEFMARVTALLRRSGRGPNATNPPSPGPSTAARDHLLRTLTEATEPQLSNVAFKVAALARAVAMSPRTLQAHMQKHGLPRPAEWLRTHRLERGAELLRSGRFSTVGEVAAAVGMSRAYFSRTYAAHTGHPPTHDLAR